MDYSLIEINVTSREKQILRLIAREYSTFEISAMLQISSRTVETHRKNINRKTNVKTLAGLTKYAIKLGLLEDFSYLPGKSREKSGKPGCSMCSQPD
ncbi:MAG: LuxR C-terminal-related transcriptional regulator [Lentimicrobium sp.]|jgi:DNA-binding CsgD family transcriptional regulator|nr:LuxR C-terminal-related transcriptional regulator [Lentimicrobium sp.]